MSRRFQNRNDWNDISFRGCSQSQFNYNGQVPHHGWDFHYAGGTFVPYQTSGPTIPAVGPLHWPQPVAYCKICEVKVGNFKNVEAHNNGKKHRRMLNLHEELERLKISNRQIPNSQVNVVVQPMTVLKSGKNGCPEKNVSSEATVAKHRNYQQKDIGVTPEVPAEGKPRDKTSAQGHNFKHKIGGGKIGKYMKKNDGLRRPMESCTHAPADSNIYTQADCENQNCTDEKDNHLLPSVVVEFNSPSGSSTNTQTTDGCSKAEQKMDILTHQSRTTQLSQVAVCLQCGDPGFQETLVFCNKCQVYALHRYCLDGPVNYTDDVTWFCEDCEPKVVETSFHDSCTLLPSGTNVSRNLGNDASRSTIEPKCSMESVKNKHEPQNIADKTTVLLSDNHSFSYHELSQCSNNTEKENKAAKECQPDTKDTANTSEGSFNATVPHPIADPVWRGSLRITDSYFGTVIGLLAHISTLACDKVKEEARFFPDMLCPDLLPRSAVWPTSYLNCGPIMDSIALYFFPDSESVERAYDKLVEDMMYFDLSIKIMVKNAELLVFPSTLLPIQCRRYQEKYYMWGVFRAKKISEN